MRKNVKSSDTNPTKGCEETRSDSNIWKKKYEVSLFETSDFSEEASNQRFWTQLGCEKRHLTSPHYSFVFLAFIQFLCQ